MADTTTSPIRDEDIKELVGDGGKRERSSIEFPYMALPDAIQVADGVHKTSGGGLCQHDQLAAKLGLSMNSSGYRVRLATARMFDLIESDRSGGGVKLTQLGHAVLDSAQEREAKAKAFLAVELYEKLYNYYRGKVLPPASALEREMASMGVAPKQTDRARQAFERSAEAAGFFEMGRDRLIMPSGIGEAPRSERDDAGSKNGGGDDGGDKPDPLIGALIQKLPKAGSDWSVQERVMWLQMMSMAFQMAYGQKDQIEIKSVEKSGS
ncbi:hypothetical protein [Dongia deserti]|uniref:hypothetical protein n=1 Tax=Dongia deserti TaxID=2268030 RepID=UPI000E64BB3D|nr:hypothetical protein [Dongia deserti]